MITSEVLSEKENSLVNNTVYAIMSKIIMSIFFLGLTAYVSRSLGVESFGNAQYITWLVATIWLVTNFGLPNTIVRYIALFRNEGLDRDVSSLIRLFFLSTVFFLILGTIGIVLFYKGATIRIILVGLLFLSTSLNNFFQSTAEGLKAFKSQLYATIL
ncbi:MAG: oligosaccharide flippase family protein, partial [Fibrobacteres bacterium]|nr:oligosaccharide flippase family protein [Fibrobacterota bacterium]